MLRGMIRREIEDSGLRSECEVLDGWRCGDIIDCNLLESGGEGASVGLFKQFCGIGDLYG